TTLENRIKEFGEGSSVVKEWVRAQDTVFSNCSGGHAIPAEAGKNDPPLIRADRAYQTGAAYFYGADFKDAEATFHSIALDKSSPWSGIANYLEARAIVRAS